MKASRHIAVTAPTSEPCPFCGCGLALAGHVARPRARARHARYQLTPVPLELLPEWWRAIVRALAAPPTPRPETAEERRYIAALNVRAGWRAVVDPNTNAIVRWERPETGGEAAAA